MIIIDTGYWLALANRKDKHHGRALELFDTLDEPFITTWPVMTETCHLLLNRLGSISQLRFIQSWIRGAFEVYEIPPESDERIFVLMKKYQDLPMDLADASLVVLAEALGSGRILSTDERDFKSYRWKNRKPFVNLMGEG